MDSIIKKTDLQTHIERLENNFSREKEMVLEGDYNLHYQFLTELLETDFKTPPKVKELKRTINHVSKKGHLKLDEIFEVIKIIDYFIYLKKLDLHSKTRKWIGDINIPDEIYEMVPFFDEKGRLVSAKDEQLSKFEDLIKRFKRELRDKVASVATSRNIKEYLVDTQVHYINEEETLLVRGGFSSVLKGKVVSRSSNGFFYVVPDSVTSIKQEINGVEERLADLLFQYEQRFSGVLSRYVGFLKFINKEFDRFDHYQARVELAKSQNLNFSLMDNSDKIILDGFVHPALTEAVPFSVKFDKKVLMITGVNAGGKTMLLKSILSAVFMSKYLIPFKFNPKKTVIGKFKNIEAIIEDPQNSKNDISTFAGRMKEFSQILKNSNQIVGIDEIELGTDSDEAASLFKVILEELIQKKTKVIITTHHKRLAAMMAGNEEVSLIAAMYDEQFQKPLYRFLEGSIGKSYAFETASRYGISDLLVKRAKEVYGEDKEKLNDLIQRSSELELELNRKLKELEEKSEKLDRERSNVKADKDKFYEDLMAKRSKLEGKFREAVNSAKEAAKMNKPQEIHKKLNEAYKSKKSLGKCQVDDLPDFKVGDSVKYLSNSCIILKVRKDDVLLDVDGKKVYAPKIKISSAPKVPKKPNKSKVNVQKPTKMQIKLDLHGKRADDALDELDKFVSDALIVGYDELLIYHGIGSGILSRVVKDYLKEHPHVKSIEDAHPSLGGSGATVATL
ncbi:MAG: endonuclease MutS2 [Campylobacterales bacterium]|nr:endonuclease MutS2 [Campylobacterales bacterium]